MSTSNSSEQSQTEHQFLHQLYDLAWFGTDDNKRIFVRYYSITGLPRQTLTQTASSVEQYIMVNIPFRLAIAEISDQMYKLHHPWLVSNERGESEIVVEILQRQLPRSLYAVLTTPLVIGLSDWDSVAKRMDRLVALIRAAIGTNFLHKLAREAVVEIPTGNMVAPTPVVNLPQSADGPFLNKENFDEIKEILNGLGNQSSMVADRIGLALELFERGAQETSGSKFFYYWVATEVLCDTHQTARILTKLVNAYAETRSYVQNNLGFDFIKSMRQDLFHRGRPHDMPQDVERYIQAMFVDLLRFQLGLACRKHMGKQIAEGFSIDRLRREIGQSNIVTIDAL